MVILSGGGGGGERLIRTLFVHPSMCTYIPEKYFMYGIGTQHDKLKLHNFIPQWWHSSHLTKTP